MNPIAQRTLAHYQRNADGFWQGTRDHDVSQNVNALLSAISNSPPFDILDLGCGPGRDLLTFKQLGHRPVGLDACPAFVQMARDHAACPVWQQNLLSLDLPPERFDGVFANAVLFHVPSAHISAVLNHLRQTLRPGGVLFTSNPRGQGQEGWQGERYGVYYNWTQWRNLLLDHGYELVDHFYRPQGLPRNEQGWIASVWRRPVA